MLEKLDGIIIKTQDYGESHKIVTMLSKQLGKLSGIARGAKKPKSRMAAVTQPFIHGNYLVYVNKGLSTIQQGEIVDSFRNIREDIIKTAYAAYIAELTDKLLESRQPDIYIYDQFYRTLTWISNHDEITIPILMYEIKLYQKGGIGPIVDRCVQCGQRDRLVSFSVMEGGLLCEGCQTTDSQAIRLPQSLIKLVYIMANIGLERVGNSDVKQQNQALLRKMFDDYYDRYGGYYLKSRKFLQQLDSLEQNDFS